MAFVISIVVPKFLLWPCTLNKPVTYVNIYRITWLPNLLTWTLRIVHRCKTDMLGVLECYVLNHSKGLKSLKNVFSNKI